MCLEKVAEKCVQIDLNSNDTGMTPGTYWWDVCILWPGLPWTPMDQAPFIIKVIFISQTPRRCKQLTSQSIQLFYRGNLEFDFGILFV